MRRPQQIKHSVYQVPLLEKSSLPEGVIIDLHEMFLTKGTHHIRVADLQSGRALIDELLSSLNYYQNIGFLSLNAPKDVPYYHDLYALLNECGYIDNDGNHDFDQFFSEAFFLDFMIIETTEQLNKRPWFKELKQSIAHLSFDAQLPVIIMTYNQ